MASPYATGVAALISAATGVRTGRGRLHPQPAADRADPQGDSRGHSLLSGCAVARNTKSWVGIAKARAYRQRGVCLPRKTPTGRPWTERYPLLRSRREGGGVILQPPRLLLDSLRRPDQIGLCQWPGSGWQALPSHQSEALASRPTGGAGAGWMSELATRELGGHSQVREPAEVNTLVT